MKINANQSGPERIAPKCHCPQLRQLKKWSSNNALVISNHCILKLRKVVLIKGLKLKVSDEQLQRLWTLKIVMSIDTGKYFVTVY